MPSPREEADSRCALASSHPADGMRGAPGSHRTGPRNRSSSRRPTCTVRNGHPCASIPEYPPRLSDEGLSHPGLLQGCGGACRSEEGTKTLEGLSQVIDLTAQYRGGVQWNAPEGEWSVLRFVCSNNGQKLIVPSPNSNGLFIDFFDPEATKRHLQYFMDRLGVTPENSAEGGLAYFEFDSMELAEGSPGPMPLPPSSRNGRDTTSRSTCRYWQAGRSET